MKTLNLLSLLVVGGLLSGCVMQERKGPVSMVGSQQYVARESAAVSLFPSDQAVLSDEAVAKILASKLELPAKAKVALMKFSDDGFGVRYYGSYYWRDEQYMKLQQEQVDVISKILLTSDQITDVTLLPSLMIPKQKSIPVLREAALRMQADLLLVYRVNSDIYSQYRMFSKDQVKAYSTCEIVLLDVRTGLVPFTKVISREKVELMRSNDLSLSETMRRAEQESAVEALRAAADDLAAFVKSVPKKAN